MRQECGAKKLRQLSRLIGIKVVSAMVRGGTNHRYDITFDDDRRASYWPRYDDSGKRYLEIYNENRDPDVVRWYPGGITVFDNPIIKF